MTRDWGLGGSSPAAGVYQNGGASPAVFAPTTLSP